jgi:hypothetical protein
MWKYLADRNLIYVYEDLCNIQNIKIRRQNSENETRFFGYLYWFIFYYNSDNRGAGLDANNVVVTA